MEQCDAGDRNGDAPEFTCRSNCILPWCGDGILDYNEECDDHNKINGDRCSAVCTTESPSAPPLTGDITTLDAVLTSNRNPSSNGQPVTFTYTMRLDKPELCNGTGQVEFTDERTAPSTVLGNQPLQDCSASLTTTSLSLGTHTILGTYSMNSNQIKIPSNVVHQRVLSGALPSPARSETGPGLIIFLASGAAAGYGLMRRRLKRGGR
jgi:cysteine-rich repeat protein